MKAFPSEDSKWNEYADGYIKVRHPGMDLRDYFAAKASEQDIQEHLWERVGGYGKIASCTREEAKYKYADAMLKARESK